MCSTTVKNGPLSRHCQICCRVCHHVYAQELVQAQSLVLAHTQMMVARTADIWAARRLTAGTWADDTRAARRQAAGTCAARRQAAGTWVARRQAAGTWVARRQAAGTWAARRQAAGTRPGG